LTIIWTPAEAFGGARQAQSGILHPTSHPK
jgi:hypothetical protein